MAATQEARASLQRPRCLRLNDRARVSSPLSVTAKIGEVCDDDLGRRFHHDLALRQNGPAAIFLNQTLAGSLLTNWRLSFRLWETFSKASRGRVGGFRAAER